MRLIGCAIAGGHTVIDDRISAEDHIFYILDISYFGNTIKINLHLRCWTWCPNDFQGLWRSGLGNRVAARYGRHGGGTPVAYVPVFIHGDMVIGRVIGDTASLVRDPRIPVDIHFHAHAGFDAAVPHAITVIGPDCPVPGSALLEHENHSIPRCSGS